MRTKIALSVFLTLVGVGLSAGCALRREPKAPAGDEVGVTHPG
jgi:hypothetical protein